MALAAGLAFASVTIAGCCLALGVALTLTLILTLTPTPTLTLTLIPRSPNPSPNLPLPLIRCCPGPVRVITATDAPLVERGGC